MERQQIGGAKLKLTDLMRLSNWVMFFLNFPIKVLVFKVPIVIMTKILTMDCVFMTSIIKAFTPIFYLIPSLETHSISLSLGLTLVMMNMMNK